MLLQISDGLNSSTIIAMIVTGLIGFVILALIFLLIRSILLWYWKVNVIIGKLDKQAALLENANRKDTRANYYKALALGDNKQAYECLLYMTFNDLLEPSLTAEQRQKRYDELKAKNAKVFNSLGYEFPQNPF